MVGVTQRWLHPERSPIPAYILFALCAYFVAAYALNVAWSIGFPYALEWLEGGTMDGVQRAANGLPIYAQPALEYTPFMYTPLYYYIAAAFTHIFGMGFFAGRLVSLLSILGMCGLLYVWMRRESLSQRWAAIAPCLFLATFGVVSGWFHLARVDSLFLFLTFFGAFIYIQYQSTLSAVMAGLVMTLAFFTKQQALACLSIMLVFGLLAYPRRTIITAGVFAIYSLLLIWIYQQATEGWFSLFVFEMPATLPTNFKDMWKFWPRDIFKVMPIVFSLCCWAGFVSMAHNWRKGLLYIGLVGGTLAAAWGSRIHVLGWNNVLMPAYAAMVLVSVLTLSISVREKWMAANLAHVLLAVQMLFLLYNPYERSPHGKYADAAQKHMDYIASIQGEVLIPDMQFQQSLVGKKSYTYRMNAVDVMQADFGERNYVKRELRGELVEALKNKKFAAIILNKRSDIPEKDAYYQFKETILDRGTSPFITGWMEFPNYVYVPRN